MLKKVLLGAVMAAALMVEMPMMASAATNANKAALNKPQITFQIGRNRRWRHRRDYDNDYYRRNRMTSNYRLVPQYYWMNGRRYVRYVRVNNF
jgi:Ni/Co efflux regulator RcnB